MRRCLLALCATIAACTGERYPGDESGVYARGGMALDSVSFDQGVAVDVFARLKVSIQPFFANEPSIA